MGKGAGKRGGKAAGRRSWLSTRLWLLVNPQAPVNVGKFSHERRHRGKIRPWRYACATSRRIDWTWLERQANPRTVEMHSEESGSLCGAHAWVNSIAGHCRRSGWLERGPRHWRARGLADGWRAQPGIRSRYHEVRLREGQVNGRERGRGWVNDEWKVEGRRGA